MLAILRRWCRSTTAIWLFVRLDYASRARKSAAAEAARAHSALSTAEDRLLLIHRVYGRSGPSVYEPACMTAAITVARAQRHCDAAIDRYRQSLGLEEALAARLSIERRHD